MTESKEGGGEGKRRDAEEKRCNVVVIKLLVSSSEGVSAKGTSGRIRFTHSWRISHE